MGATAAACAPAPAQSLTTMGNQMKA